MTAKLITNGAWTRIFVSNANDLEQAERLTGVDLRPHTNQPLFMPAILKVAYWRSGKIELADLIIANDGKNLITVEAGDGLPFLNDLGDRLRRQNLNKQEQTAVFYVAIQAAYDAATQILDEVETHFDDIRLSVRNMQLSLDQVNSHGVSDLPELDDKLTTIAQALSHVAHSFGQLVQCARILRREAKYSSEISRQNMDDLIADGESSLRRVQFVVDRQRFHARQTAQVVATSDLNVIKIFTILWTVFLPGTALVNWYGQNFQTMPELSWYWSTWIQIFGVLILTVIPIMATKMSGQLR